MSWHDYSATVLPQSDNREKNKEEECSHAAIFFSLNSSMSPLRRSSGNYLSTFIYFFK